ncbi:MAG TPA: protein phosphatase 2C domain-containing protein [Chitinophagales bacterium]
MKHTATTNIGSRKKNEDYCYESEKLFVVCDGVGGNAYGEVASKLACASFADYFKQNSASVYDCDFLKSALQYTIQKFKETEQKYPETSGMATTIVLIAFDESGIIVAWLGDSRLYHVRDGEIRFITDDHSLKNEMAKDGKDVSTISRNIITKALSAKTDCDFSYHGISKEELQQGDYFFLCTDGVLENISDEILCRELATDNDFEEKAQIIFSLCEGKTKDNFTFQLIEL